MKKYILILLAAMMIFSLVGCGRNNIQSENSQNDKYKSGYEVNPELTVDEPGNRKKLTLAAFTLMPNIEERIITFNSTNKDYYVEVLDYSQYNTDEDISAGQTKLNTDIMSGNTPDMIELGKTPIEKYTNKGLLEDINSFLEKDSEFSKENLVSGIYNAISTDDKLYRITPSVSMIGLYGKESKLGKDLGWTISEAKELLEENKSVECPFINMPKQQILNSLIMYSLDNYVNRAEGKANFVCDEFISLLEIVSEFGNVSNNEYVEPDVSIAENKGLVATKYIGGIKGFAKSFDYLNGDMKMIGFPTDDKSGNIADFMFSFGMFSDSENKEGCWQFLRSFLEEDYQKEQNSYNEIPILKKVFDSTVEEFKGSEDAKNLYLSTVNHMTRSSDFDGIVIHMIEEEAEKFLSGSCSAEEAAKTIQSKVGIYLSENK